MHAKIMRNIAAFDRPVKFVKNPANQSYYQGEKIKYSDSSALIT